jgi:MFS family permease
MPSVLFADLPSLSRDTWLIAWAHGVRTFAQGAVSVLVAIYLHLLGFSLAQIGLFISVGLAGAAVFSFSIIFIADAVGRRRLLVVFALLSALAGLAMAVTDQFLLLAFTAFIGGLNVGGGAAAGPAQPLEQASLAETVSPERRTAAYAVYSVMTTAGGSLGALTAGLPVFLQGSLGLGELASYRTVFLAFSGLTVLAALLYALLSQRVEVAIQGRRWSNPLRLPSRRMIFTLSGLFAVDHFAGGLVVQSLVALWFYTRFGIDVSTLALVFFGSNLMAAVSMWAATKLAGRIGLINTMVFTHIPSSLLLIAIPFLPYAWLAIAFWLVRGFFGMMDVPTRQSYTMAIVGPNERSAMAGITNVTRGVTGAASPSVATALWSIGAASIPFVACGVIKIAYDLSLYALFRNVRTPEEAARQRRGDAAVPIR